MTFSDRLELVMFDLDGTLVATAPEIQDAVNDTLGRFDFQPVRLAEVERWIGHGTQQLLAQALALRTGWTAERLAASELFGHAAADFAGSYARHCGTRSTLYPGVRQVLEALGARGVKRAIVTNKEQRFTEQVLRCHALDGLIDRVVSGDSLPTRKPDPAGVMDCLRAFGASPGCSLLIGDSSIDVATARNAGVPVWALTWGYNMGQPIAAADPDRLLDSLEPLLDETPCAGVAH